MLTLVRLPPCITVTRDSLPRSRVLFRLLISMQGEGGGWNGGVRRWGPPAACMFTNLGYAPPMLFSSLTLGMPPSVPSACSSGPQPSARSSPPPLPPWAKTPPLLLRPP